MTFTLEFSNKNENNIAKIHFKTRIGLKTLHSEGNII